MNQAISSLMEREVWTADMDATVADVERELTLRHLSWAPVLEPGGVIVGVISASDLLQFHAQGRDPTTQRAWQLCSYKPISVEAATPISEVARRMVEQRIHHVVVTQQGSIAGVVSSLDFVRTFIDRA
jgi:signal-transduction protein with cAMP-binding, CBS, and nucleotidyltransferase domain